MDLAGQNWAILDEGSRFWARVGLGCEVLGLGCEVLRSGREVLESGVGVRGFGIRVRGFGIRVRGFGIGVRGFGIGARGGIYLKSCAVVWVTLPPFAPTTYFHTTRFFVVHTETAQALGLPQKNQIYIYICIYRVISHEATSCQHSIKPHKDKDKHGCSCMGLLDITARPFMGRCTS